VQQPGRVGYQESTGTSGDPVSLIQFPGKVKDACEMVKRFGAKQTRWFIDWQVEALKAGRQVFSFRTGDPTTAETDTTATITGVVIESICAADIKPKRKEWLWRDRIPLKNQAIFSGLPDTGKSTVARDIAARVSTGRPFPNNGENPYGPRNVLILSSEEQKEDTYVPSLLATRCGSSAAFILPRRPL